MKTTTTLRTSRLTQMADTLTQMTTAIANTLTAVKQTATARLCATYTEWLDEPVSQQRALQIFKTSIAFMLTLLTAAGPAWLSIPVLLWFIDNLLECRRVNNEE